MNENQTPPVQDSGFPAPPPMPGAKGSNGVATAALVFGIISVFISPLFFIAIILGIIGIVKAGKVNSGKGKAIAGLILGCLPIILIPILLPALNTARSMAKDAMSMVNLQSIGKSMELYQLSYEVYPDKPGRLIEQGYVSIKPFSNPSSPNAAQMVDGDVVTDGYMFIMPDENSKPRDIVAYENEEYAFRGNVEVLYVNGVAEKIPVSQLHSKLAAQGIEQGSEK